MILPDTATTIWFLLFVLPQLPRPGSYQVPYDPKCQRRWQSVTERDTYPATTRERGAYDQLAHSFSD